MEPINRRTFIHKTGKSMSGLAAGVSALSLSNWKRAYGANEKVVMGLVGCGGRGTSLVRGFARRPNVEIAYLCDPDGRRGNETYELFKTEHNLTIKKLQDFRKILDDKDLDVLIVATPDHWHAPATIYACQAGKDVYVEKPASHNIWEGRKMVEAARKYNRIVQVGTQTRSAPYAMKAVDYIQSGKLGTIHLCKIYNLKSGNPYHARPNVSTPPELDMDLWLGPAPLKENYHADTRKGWLFYWDFCGGDMGNDGVHQIDFARMLIGKEFAKTIHCTGGNLAFDDDSEVPDTQVATFEFDNMIVTFENTQYAPYMSKTPMEIRESDQFPYWPQNSTRIELYGAKELMIAGRHGGGWQVFTTDGKVVAQEYGRFPDEAHKDDFLSCVKSRKLPNADIEKGHRSAILVHMGNISYRLGGRKLTFDPATETFDDAEANQFLKRTYREPYTIPEQV